MFPFGNHIAQSHTPPSPEPESCVGLIKVLWRDRRAFALRFDESFNWTAHALDSVVEQSLVFEIRRLAPRKPLRATADGFTLSANMSLLARSETWTSESGTVVAKEDVPLEARCHLWADIAVQAGAGPLQPPPSANTGQPEAGA